MCRVTVLNLEFLRVRSNRVSVCRITVFSLESLLVRSNRIPVCRMTVFSLESLLVRSNRIYVCHITVFSLESLLVRWNRFFVCRSLAVFSLGYMCRFTVLSMVYPLRVFGQPEADLYGSLLSLESPASQRRIYVT